MYHVHRGPNLYKSPTDRDSVPPQHAFVKGFIHKAYTAVSFSVASSKTHGMFYWKDSKQYTTSEKLKAKILFISVQAYAHQSCT